MNGTPDKPSSPNAGALRPVAMFAIVETPAPPGITLLELSGEIDIASAQSFRGHVEAVLERSELRLVADLAAVTFMESTMLKELLRAQRDLGAAGGVFVVAAASPAVLRLLDLTRTAGLLTLAGSREEALARAAPSPPAER